MSARASEADRLRALRLAFERAVADRVSLPEARRRIAAEAQAERAALRARAIAEVGRWRDAAPAAFISADDSDDGLAWWQR